jgi:FKBP-type peptidyl-prolyl cis-trans isomerase FkpA
MGLVLCAALVGCRDQREASERTAAPREPAVEFAAEDLAIGAGAVCEGANPIVTLHYRGTLLDGSEFDSSYRRGAPIVAQLDTLIAGWRRGIPGMRVGGKRRLTVPADLAYSGMAALQPNAAGGAAARSELLIPPGSALVFEIELLDVSPGGPPGPEALLAREPAR